MWLSTVAIVVLVIVAIIVALILTILLAPITYSIEIDGRTPYAHQMAVARIFTPLSVHSK